MTIAVEGIFAFLHWLVPLLCKIALMASWLLLGIYMARHTWRTMGAVMGFAIGVLCAGVGTVFEWGRRTNITLSAKP
jgi:hypothetical protein